MTVGVTSPSHEAWTHDSESLMPPGGGWNSDSE